MAQELLLPMMVNGDDDPLLQISVLDMVLQELQKQHKDDSMDTTTTTTTTDASNTTASSFSNLTLNHSSTTNNNHDLKVFLATNLPWQKLK